MISVRLFQAFVGDQDDDGWSLSPERFRQLMKLRCWVDYLKTTQDFPIVLSLTLLACQPLFGSSFHITACLIIWMARYEPLLNHCESWLETQAAGIRQTSQKRKLAGIRIFIRSDLPRNAAAKYDSGEKSAADNPACPK